ncbi:hypothetical protein EfmAA610_35540 (plasmid) [Enterococcus faecium]|nr:hypothetical protein EfmAA610_35540 [Enterococcus faecium]
MNDFNYYKSKDSDDNIFFIFTVEELMKLLQCREGKVSKIKKELEKAGLLKQKRGRVNKRDDNIFFIFTVEELMLKN